MFKLLSVFIFVATMSTAMAQDLGDNDVCLDCHELAVTVVHETHVEDWSCVDCHDYVENLEHEDTAPDGEVDCLNCHDEVPDVN